MNGAQVMKETLLSLGHLIGETVGGVRPAEWTSRLRDGENMLGFIAWHMPATQDWAVHTWIRNVPEVRDATPWSERFASARDCAPFGMRLAQADQIAQSTDAEAVIAYNGAVLACIGGWLDGISDTDLDAIPDTRRHGLLRPQHRTHGYLQEVDDMYDLPVWRLLTGPCFGHVRGHLAELDLAVNLIRSGKGEP